MAETNLIEMIDKLQKELETIKQGEKGLLAKAKDLQIQVPTEGTFLSLNRLSQAQIKEVVTRLFVLKNAWETDAKKFLLGTSKEQCKVQVRSTSDDVTDLKSFSSNKSNKTYKIVDMGVDNILSILKEVYNLRSVGEREKKIKDLVKRSEDLLTPEERAKMKAEILMKDIKEELGE